jgi:DNA mismatch endonuclease (patch repair protein)
MAFIGKRKVIFVNGCFWHGHDCKRGSRVPQNNRSYWLSKIERNRARDTENATRLRQEGWKALTLWECELGEVKALGARLQRFLR